MIHGDLLYKQLIRPTIVFRAPLPLPAPTSGDWKFCNANVFTLIRVQPCKLLDRHIHEDLGVPLSTDHIRALRVLTQSYLTSGNPKFGNSTDSYHNRGFVSSPDPKAEEGRS